MNFWRGHEIELDPLNQWQYSDTKEPTVEAQTSRPCGRCGMYRTTEGHDGCLGALPDVMNACCGHGHGEAYLQFSDGFIVAGEAALVAIEFLKEIS